MVSRPYTAREELLNVATHAGGIVASLIALCWLVAAATRDGDVRRVIGGAAFGIAAVLLFGASTLYHAFTRPSAKTALRKIDHCAIYVLIASTYTAFTLSVMRDRVGWALFAAVWVLAALGIAAEFRQRDRKPLTASLLYVLMGWIGLLTIRELTVSLTGTELWWVVAGGVCYTAGVPFYVAKSRPYSHCVWHLFVLAGVACHFVAVLGVMHAS